MSTIINKTAIDKMVDAAIQDELNESLDYAVDKTIEAFKPKIRERIAAKVITLIQSDYNVEYMNNELKIGVRIKD